MAGDLRLLLTQVKGKTVACLYRAVVPGTAFGACGEGFVRCAYATNLANIKEAMVRFRRFIGRR